MWIAQKNVKNSTTFNLSMDKTKVKAPPGSKNDLPKTRKRSCNNLMLMYTFKKESG